MNEAIRNLSKADIPQQAREDKTADMTHRVEMMKKFVQIQK
jgi:hypothetical protein